MTAVSIFAHLRFSVFWGRVFCLWNPEAQYSLELLKEVVDVLNKHEGKNTEVRRRRRRSRRRKQKRKRNRNRNKPNRSLQEPRELGLTATELAMVSLE